MKSDSLLPKGRALESERKRRQEMADLYEKSPIPRSELLMNLGVFVNRRLMARLLFLNEIYKRIVDVHGIVVEFGVRWGQNLAVFEALRGVYEPYNYTRRIVGFDTFEGFPSVNEKDGHADSITEGALGVTPGYENYLMQILAYHEMESPIPHIKKSEIIKGDATVTIKKFFESHPESIIALAYFDFDLYEPTKEAILAVRDRLTKGSVLAFDELNFPEFPGETLALKETLGLSKYKIQRCPFVPTTSFMVID